LSHEYRTFVGVALGIIEDAYSVLLVLDPLALVGDAFIRVRAKPMELPLLEETLVHHLIANQVGAVAVRDSFGPDTILMMVHIHYIASPVDQEEHAMTVEQVVLEPPGVRRPIRK
jgi:hypothetical protein